MQRTPQRALTDGKSFNFRKGFSREVAQDVAWGHFQEKTTIPTLPAPSSRRATGRYERCWLPGLPPRLPRFAADGALTLPT